MFYLEKRKKYTSIQTLELSIELQGYKSLVLVHDGTDLETVPLEPNHYGPYQIPFPYDAYTDGVVWFALLEDTAIIAQDTRVLCGDRMEGA